MKDNSIKSISMFLFAIFGVCILIAGFYFIQYSKAKDTLANKKTSMNDILVVKKELNDKYKLTTDETPTIVTITDKKQLQKNPFFDKAENGDKVLIFIKLKKAILFRPSSNSIIEISPLTIISDTPTPPGNIP